MRFPAEAIASALNQFYEGASQRNIQRQLQLTYGVRPSQATISRWIVRYSQQARQALNNVPIKTGTTWVATETALKYKGNGRPEAWFWDVLDEKTRFLLASQLLDSRGAKDAQTLLERAAWRAGRLPGTVITDKLADYLDGMELALAANTKHIQSRSLRIRANINLLKRTRGTLKHGAKVARPITRRSTARIVIDGWVAHCNFFRPQSALGGRTPAEVAGAKVLFKSWLDVVAGRQNDVVERIQGNGNGGN
jgi:transposase-like protein